MTAARVKLHHILEATGGGTRRHVRDLLTHLDPELFELSLSASPLREKGFADDIDEFRRLGVTVHLVPTKRGVSPIIDAFAYHRLSKIIKQGRFDIVHTHSSKAGILGRLAAARYGVATIIHTPHVFPFQMNVGPTRKRFYLQLERMAARRTTRLVSVCEAERRTAVQAGLFQAGDVTVIHNGVDPAEWRPAASSRRNSRRHIGIPDDAFVIGLIGRFMEQKGHRLFVEAANLVAQRTDARFLLVGDGPTKPAVIQTIERTRLAARFVILPHREDVAACYAACDIIALPSLWEACPYTILEAMAMGLPVVATATGGVPEIIADRVNGRLSPPGDAAALADRLIALRENRDARAALGAAAGETVTERFQRERMIRAHQDLYVKLHNR